MEKLCHKCGAELGNGAKFCLNCGARLEGGSDDISSTISDAVSNSLSRQARCLAQF